MVCPMPEFLGTWLDLDRNEANAAVISIPEIRVTVRVMHTEEEIQIAQSVCRLLAVVAYQ